MHDAKVVLVMIASQGDVRVEINGDLQRSEVFRSHDVLTAGETWSAAMIEKGWR